MTRASYALDWQVKNAVMASVSLEYSNWVAVQVQTLMLRFWGGGADKNRFHTRNCNFPSPTLRSSNTAAQAQTSNRAALEAACAFLH